MACPVCKELHNEIMLLRVDLRESERRHRECGVRRDELQAEVEKLRANLQREHELHQSVEADFHATVEKLKKEIEFVTANRDRLAFGEEQALKLYGAERLEKERLQEELEALKTHISLRRWCDA